MHVPPFQIILVGYDGTETSEPALDAGLELARRLHASVEIVHAVSVPSPLWPGVDPARLAAINAEALTSAWKLVRDPVRAALDRRGGVGRPVEDLLRVLPGSAAHVLLERAGESGADIVVLGSHHKRGLFDFGSTARAVLARAEADVWVQPCPPREIERILVPVDLSEDSLGALSRACALARELGASIRTLHCFPPLDFSYAQGLTYPAREPTYVLEQARRATLEEYERVMAEFDWRELQHAHDFVEGEPASSILELQDAVDLIVMGTHGRTGLSAAVLGNVAYGVLKEAGIPVLAVRHAERKWLA